MIMCVVHAVVLCSHRSKLKEPDSYIQKVACTNQLKEEQQITVTMKETIRIIVTLVFTQTRMQTFCPTQTNFTFGLMR